MYDTEQRTVLVRLLANIDQQAADAKALLLELPPHGDEHEAILNWISELRLSAERARRLIAILDQKYGNRPTK